MSHRCDLFLRTVAFLIRSGTRLKFENRRVKTASFLTDGCGAGTECGFLAAETALDRTPEQLADVTDDTLLGILCVFPEEDRHCVFLAAETLQEALDDYMQKLTKSIANAAPEK
jgi:nitrogen fixation NifU-like protein